MVRQFSAPAGPGQPGCQVPVPHERRYSAGLDSLLAAIRGDAPPERSLDHQLSVQETLLRAIGLA